jgi:hypothetical protein
MPLRDHFRPPVSKQATWEGFHGMWPSTIVQHLRTRLPPGFVAEPRVHLGAFMEIDVSAYEADNPPAHQTSGAGSGEGATQTATFPITAVETELPEEYEYAVHVYDAERERTLVAAIEIVSPGNKDRPDKRNAFVGKCAALLRRGVAVGVVDLVTARQFNLYAELMGFVGHPELAPGGDPPIYAASCRWVPRGTKNFLESWSVPLAVGRPLPVLPLWLSEALIFPLDLEAPYEQACRDLWIA